MSSKIRYGKCKLCGELKQLTFEHVPPKSAFNNVSATIISGDEIIQSIADEERKPWEFRKYSGKIQQRGKGGFYLCGVCNNNAGQWYATEYIKFVGAIHCALKLVGEAEYGSLGIKMKNIRPLAVFKQVMMMFCDINEGLMGDDSLKTYLLDKKMTEFNKDKYSLYAYIHTGNIERMHGICAVANNKGIYFISEISGYPIGLALYIDKPKDFKPEGVEITLFSEFEYDDLVEMEVIIPKLENNIFFPGDYRTKDEILNCMRGNV